VRAKQLDTRIDGGKVLAVFLEADTQRPLPVAVDVQAGKLVKLAPFPCRVFRGSVLPVPRRPADRSSFLIGKDGRRNSG
jgi:3-phytase